MGVRDLAQRRFDLDCIEDQRQQVLVAGGGLLDAVQGAASGPRVAVRAQDIELFDLALTDGRIDPQDFGLDVVLDDESIDADFNVTLGPGGCACRSGGGFQLDAPLKAERGLHDLTLWVALFDGAHCPAERVDAGDVGLRLCLDLVGNLFQVKRAR